MATMQVIIQERATNSNRVCLNCPPTETVNRVNEKNYEHWRNSGETW